MKKQAKTVLLTKNAASGWSYEDDVYFSRGMNLIEAASLFIARVAGTLQHIDDKGEDAKIEIVVRKC